MSNRRITIEFNGEKRTTILYEKNNGNFVYWSPFTNARVELNKYFYRNAYREKSDKIGQRIARDIRREIEILEKRLEKSVRVKYVIK